MPVVRKRYYQLASEIHPDKHPEDVNGATERFQRLVASYAIILAYYEVLKDACKNLNLNVATITVNEVRAWKNLHKDILLKPEEKCDEETRQMRKSFMIVYRHTAYTDQTSCGWLRRFLNGDKHETFRKKKPAQLLTLIDDSQS